MPKIEISDEVMQWLEVELKDFQEMAAYAAAHGTQFNGPKTVDEIADSCLRSFFPFDHGDDDDIPF